MAPHRSSSPYWNHFDSRRDSPAYFFWLTVDTGNQNHYLIPAHRIDYLTENKFYCMSAYYNRKGRGLLQYRRFCRV